MFLLFYFLIFSFGAAVGSFLGVIVDRLSSKESFWKGRSHCDHCRHALGPGDLIPILSFFLLKKKCRYCHKTLSWFYPSVEFVTGFVYVVILYTFSLQGLLQLPYAAFFPSVLYYFLLSASLIAIFFADLRYGIIPFKIVLFALLITLSFDLSAIFFNTAIPWQHLSQVYLINILGSAIGAGGFFFLLFAFTKGRGMGFGDVIYAFLMGIILGFPRVILGLYLAFVAGAIVSLILVALKKKRIKGGTIPFGPFLVAGTLTGLLWGDFLIQAFLQHIIF